MQRRRLLASTGVAVGTPLTGCLGSERGSPERGGGSETERDCDPPEYPDYDGEYPRLDEPPHDVPVADETELDPHALGECMEPDPTLEFTVRRPAVNSKREYTYDTTYRTVLVTDETERDRYLDYERLDDDARTELTAIDFDESVLVGVESGWNLGTHRWARVEPVDGGIHLHGYHELPTDSRLDIRGATSLLEVERPETVDFARVSLTGYHLDRVKRVTFDSTEGIVKLAGGDVPETYRIEATYIDEEISPSNDQCQFEDLEDDVKPAVESAVENGTYRTSERPALFTSDCYGELIRYEGDVYVLEVRAS